MLTPPLGSILDIFEFENILMAEDPRTNILKGLLRHIHIEKGQIKCSNFSFLGWGLRVIYNSDIFEKSRPTPLGFKSSQIENVIFLFVFSTTVLHYEISHKNFCIKIVAYPLAFCECS